MKTLATALIAAVVLSTQAMAYGASISLPILDFPTENPVVSTQGEIQLPTKPVK